ncbi:SDR family NAD(P)-dependent oxidoreductase [endosymbiont of Riftia pachyptila]|uniref:Alternative dihydrofolate reductase 1 n=1 Tax=endosymbiont of Riftia pachyptila (vent Ph05) TaxID=1048808 RepID=G2DHH3_9GAMM|nr:alternative dihydrofolate reductase 1 [endosymbiont of Riftia pachyptila (vent Ph05)]
MRYGRADIQSWSIGMTQNGSSLAGKAGLITGGVHRIGAAIARQLHAEGMDLILHYRSSSVAAAELQATLQAQRPDSVLLLQADLHQTDQLEGLIEQAVKFRGPRPAGQQRLKLLPHPTGEPKPGRLG